MAEVGGAARLRYAVHVSPAPPALRNQQVVQSLGSARCAGASPRRDSAGTLGVEPGSSPLDPPGKARTPARSPSPAPTGPSRTARLHPEQPASAASKARETRAAARRRPLDGDAPRATTSSPACSASPAPRPCAALAGAGASVLVVIGALAPTRSATPAATAATPSGSQRTALAAADRRGDCPEIAAIGGEFRPRRRPSPARQHPRRVRRRRIERLRIEHPDPEQISNRARLRPTALREDRPA